MNAILKVACFAIACIALSGCGEQAPREKPPEARATPKLVENAPEPEPEPSPVHNHGPGDGHNHPAGDGHNHAAGDGHDHAAGDGHNHAAGSDPTRIETHGPAEASAAPTPLIFKRPEPSPSPGK